MNPMMMELLPLVHQGYCCSQLLLLLMLQAQDKQNPGVVRAAQGLCHGIGQSDGPCGLLTGGACALALVAGKGAENEIPHPMLTPPCSMITPRGFMTARKLTAASGAGRLRLGLARLPALRANSQTLWPAVTCWRNAGEKSWNWFRVTSWI